MICGVDEAGKGSVLGPMVVAAVGCHGTEDLASLPIQDSKVLQPRQREALYEILIRDFVTAVATIDAAGIDKARSKMNMNECVARLHAEVLDKLRPDLAYVDACDVNAGRYGRVVAGYLDYPCDIIAEHRADARYAIVGASSIVAKVVRDRAIRDLDEVYGSIGSGYPSDPVTIGFLKQYIQDYGTPPPCARRSWKTVKNLSQTTFEDFL